MWGKASGPSSANVSQSMTNETKGESMINIREYRKAHKLSQSQLGREIGLTRQAVSQIETGRNRPDVDTAKKMGKVLGFDWWRIYDEDAE